MVFFFFIKRDSHDQQIENYIMPLIFTSFCPHKFDIRKIFKLEKYAAKNEFGSGFNNFLKKKNIKDNQKTATKW